MSDTNTTETVTVTGFDATTVAADLGIPEAKAYGLIACAETLGLFEKDSLKTKSGPGRAKAIYSIPENFATKWAELGAKMEALTVTTFTGVSKK